MLKGLCDIAQFLLNTVIIMTSFLWGQHWILDITIVAGDWNILILQKLRFGVCHCFYCLLIYNNYVILSCFILNCHITFLFSQILNLFICGIFEHKLFAVDKSIHNLQFLITNNKYSNQVYVIKQSNNWKTWIYQGSDDSCEVDCDSDLKRLAL